MADLKEVLKDVQSQDMNDWYKATQEAGALGHTAVKPLAELMKLDDRTKGRAAMLSLQAVVNTAAAPGNEAEKKLVAAELVKVASATSYPRMVRSDALYFLGLIGGPEDVPGISKLLADRMIREDARMALERIPGDESLQALRKAESSGATDFRKNIAQSVHNRGLTKETVGIKSTAGSA
jgi:HEAT repeat protein